MKYGLRSRTWVEISMFDCLHAEGYCRLQRPSYSGAHEPRPVSPLDGHAPTWLHGLQEPQHPPPKD